MRFLPFPFTFCLFPLGRRSQVVRQRSAKPLFIGSIPIAASNLFNNLQAVKSVDYLALYHWCITTLHGFAAVE
jgi:hypothetical protein